MDNSLVYFINSKGKKTVLSSPQNRNYWEIGGRRGFSAPDVDIFSQKFASGETKFFGKALKPRTCSLRIICKGKDTAELDKFFFDMLDTLMDNGSDEEGRLYLKRSDGTPVYLNCVYSGGMNVEEQYRRFRMFNVEFFAADPLFWFDKTYDIIVDEWVPYVDIGFTNDHDYTIYPEFHLKAKPARCTSGNAFFRSMYSIWLEILEDPVYDGHIPEYYNISIYTDPYKRGVFGDRVIGNTRQNNVSIPEILANNGAMLQYFNSPPGLDHIDYNRMSWDYGTEGGTIVLPKFKYYLGA